MDFPIKVFEIGFGQEYIKLEILEVYGFPDQTSFRGGYDVRCNLEITVGAYNCRTQNYYTATSALYDFYIALQDCYNKVSGKATYNVLDPENYLVFEVMFTQRGGVQISGKYQDDPVVNNILDFEFTSDQSYFKEVISDLKKIVLQFGDNQGIKRSNKNFN